MYTIPVSHTNHIQPNDFTMSQQTRLDSYSLPGESLIPIRTVSSLTGINPVTLRAWERRYNLINPMRTPKGHRLYSMADVDLINQVVTLLQGGMSIGQVRQVLGDKAQSADDSLPNAGTRPPERSRNHFNLWQNYQQRMLDAVHQFDELTLDDVYNEILALYPADVVTHRLIMPVLHELGWQWQRRRDTGIAEEHFFSVFLRNKLGARLHHFNRQQTGPKLLVACLPGEQHDVGLMLFSMAALDWNYRIIMLGANMPLEPLQKVAQDHDCAAIVLSAARPPEPGILHRDLPNLIKTFARPVFVGGPISNRCRPTLLAMGVHPLPEEFTDALRAINQTLKPDH